MVEEMTSLFPTLFDRRFWDRSGQQAVVPRSSMTPADDGDPTGLRNYVAPGSSINLHLGKRVAQLVEHKILSTGKILRVFRVNLLC